MVYLSVLQSEMEDCPSTRLSQSKLKDHVHLSFHSHVKLKLKNDLSSF